MSYNLYKLDDTYIVYLLILKNIIYHVRHFIISLKHALYYIQLDSFKNKARDGIPLIKRPSTRTMTRRIQED